MQNFFIALLVQKGIIEKDEGKQIAKAMFGRPIPQDYDNTLSMVERIISEAKLTSERKYFNPADYEKKEEPKIEKKVVKTIAQKNK